MDPLPTNAGMAELEERMFGPDPTAPPAGQAGDGGPQANAELGVFAALAASLDRAAAAAERQAAAAHIDWQKVHPISLHPLANSGAGGIKDERWQPKTGWVWHIMRVTAVFLTGATAAKFHLDDNDPSGAWLLNTITVTGTPWEPRGLFLMPNQQLIPESVGGGIIVNGQALEIAVGYLPTYLT
jgi:hypothetical protein